MLRITPALLFVITTSLTLFVMMIAASSSSSSSSTSDEKRIAMRNKQNLFLKKAGIITSSSSSNKHSQSHELSSLKAAARPTSTLPFIPRASMSVLQRDLDSFALGASTVALDIPTRYMWGWGPGLSGYCGETSFQSSLLMYGSWVSAERVRYADGDEELLIGVNDEKAAKNLVLNYETYEAFKGTAQDYLDTFVKSHLEAGNPVILGFYEYIKGGDNDYDHIMIIRGIELDSKGGVVGIYFNDFHTKDVRYLGRYMKSGGDTNPLWTASRKTCTGPSNPDQPWDFCIPKSYQYSISLEGLNVANSNGIYTRALNPDWTEPDWGKEDGLNQKPIEVKFTLIVNGNLKKGTTYVVQQYNSATALTSGGVKDVAWTHEFTQTNEDNEATTLTEVVTQMSDGEYYWITVPK